MAVAATPKKPAGAKAPAARSRTATKVAAVSAAAGVATSAGEAPTVLAKRAPPPARKRLSKAFSRPLEKKHKRPVLVRDRYTLPEIEYDVLVALKKRVSANGSKVKKSDLLRAGLLLLADLDEAALLALLAKLTPVA